MLDHVERVGARKKEERIVDCFNVRTYLQNSIGGNCAPFSLVRFSEYFQTSAVDF